MPLRVLMQPCGYLPSTPYPLWLAQAESIGPEPTHYPVAPALAAVLLLVGIFVAYDIWAIVTGNPTLSELIRWGPSWLKWFVAATIGWLAIHLLVQGQRAWRGWRRFLRGLR